MPVRMAALAASTVSRRGIAARVVRIMPVLYSLLIASTARMATTAWPRSIPVRLSLAGSTAQPPDRHLVVVVLAAAAALTATVRPTVARSSQHCCVRGRTAQLAAA